LVYVDTNVIVRFLTRFPAAQYARSRALMDRVSRGEVELLLLPAVVGEVAAILHHSYKLPQRDVAERLTAFVTARGVRTDEEPIVLAALQQSRNLKDVDFIDAYVAARAGADGHAVATFDNDLPRKLGAAVFTF